MITMMGIIDFNNELAPDVYLRLGDTGRESSFVPAAPVALEGLTATLIMAKPDNTFVIAACTISDDSIIISWPEQAAAVKGFGEYCIRLKDSNDLIVYSARGNVIIDDHVLTDTMIESIAEANGLVFPDDFATIDDETESTNSTWSSSKIQGKIDSIEIEDFTGATASTDGTAGTVPAPLAGDQNKVLTGDGTWKDGGQHIYTTTERIVGKWIDGRSIYEMVYQGSDTLIGNAGTVLDSIITNYTDFTYLISARALYSNVCSDILLAVTWDNHIKAYNAVQSTYNTFIVQYLKD